MRSYIYGLNDPRSGQIRYVGYSKDPLNRFWGHLKECDNTYKSRWVQSLLRIGLRPGMFIIEEIDDKHWDEAERFWISFYKSAGANLTNRTTGGDRPEYSEESRRKLSIAAAKQFRSPTQIKEFAESGREWGRYAKGKTLSELYGNKKAKLIAHKISVARMGHKVTKSTRNKIRKSLLGKNYVPLEVRRKATKRSWSTRRKRYGKSGRN